MILSRSSMYPDAPSILICKPDSMCRMLLSMLDRGSCAAIALRTSSM